MTSKDKEILFAEFSRKWRNQLSKIAPILKYILTFPELNEGNQRLNIIDVDDLRQSQLEWVSLVPQLDNPIEASFFKEHWVPIQISSYNYFIDLSSDALPLFSTHYFSSEPYKWFKTYITKNLHQFMLDIDKPEFDVEELFQNLEEEEWEYRSDLFAERDGLGYEGMLDPSPLTKDNVFNKEVSSSYIFEDNRITLQGVNSLVVGLLPHASEITLDYFNIPLNHQFTLFALDTPFDDDVDHKVKSIKALVYVLQSIGYMNIDSFSLTFDSANNCKALFKDNEFTITHEDKAILNDFLNQYKALQKE